MSNFKIDNSTIVNQLDFSYNGKLEDISKSTTGNFLLKPSLYKTLIHSIGVTEIRIFCYKTWHGRTMDAAFNLKDEAVLNGVIGVPSSQIFNFCSPREVRFLSDDTSLISGVPCEQQLLSPSSPYDHFFYVSSKHHVILHPARQECDDFQVNNNFQIQKVIGDFMSDNSFGDGYQTFKWME